MNIKESYFFFLKNISTKDRYEFVLLTISSLFLAIIEFISVILIYPFIITLQKLKTSGTEVFNIHFFQNIFNLSNQQFTKLLLFSIIFFFIFLSLFNFFLTYKFAFYWSRIKGQFQSKVFYYYTNLNYNSLLHVNNPLIVKNIIYEVNRFISLFIAPISTILNKVFYLFLTIAGLTYIDPIISLILFGILFFYYFAAYILLKRIAKKNSISRSEKFESILKIVDDTIGNFQFLKISNLIKKENERFKKTTSNINYYDAQGDLISSLPKNLLEIIFYISGVFILSYFIKENLVFLYLAKIVIFFLVFIKSAPSFQLVYSLFVSVKGHYSCVNSLIEPLSNKKTDGLANLSLSKKTNISIISSITIKKLNFRFSDNKSRLIINNFSCNFYKDNIFAIQGTSGSGKSTFLNILMGLEKNYKGEIVVNDTNLNKISMNCWYSSITYVPQNIYLFSGSLKQNITMLENDSEINLKKLDSVISNVGLNSFIKKLDKGINSQIINNAKLISGGEKQRIALARALYKNSQVILLDEPINNLDAYNANIFKSTLQKIKKDRIIILVAHQKEIINFCDKIYNL